MITVEQLEDWMMEEGEDVLVDGPFNLTTEQEIKFVNIIKTSNKIIKALIKDGYLYEDDDIEFGDLGVGSTDKSSKLILKKFAKFLNEENITARSNGNFPV